MILLSTHKPTPTVRIYYKKSTSKLIVCPSKVGSTFLSNSFTEASNDIINSNSLGGGGSEAVYDTSLVFAAKSKWFIYRDPMERFVSWYNSFIVHKTHIFGNEPQTEDLLTRKIAYELCIAMYSPEKTFEENALMVLRNRRFKEVYFHDHHLIPMSFFFLNNGQNIKDYHIIHTKSLAQLVQREFFDSSIPADTYHYKTVVPDSLNEFRYLWNSDYIFLEPRVRAL